MDKKLELELIVLDYLRVATGHLYRPLFFKTQLSDKFEKGHVGFKMVVRLSKFDERKKNHKERYERLNGFFNDF